MHARIAQLVEQGTENPCVGGSIPSPGTMFFNGLAWLYPKSGGMLQLVLST